MGAQAIFEGEFLPKMKLGTVELTTFENSPLKPLLSGSLGFPFAGGMG